MYHKSLETVKDIPTFALPDSHIKGAAIAQVTIMDALNLVDELGRLRTAYARQLEALSLILKAFNDLFQELTDKAEGRKWLSRQIALAERQASRLRLPSWVWRLDPDGDLPAQLRHRAVFLREEARAHPDDQWDVLIEVLRSAGLPADERLIEQAIKGLTDAGS